MPASHSYSVVPYAELENFFSLLVSSAQGRGIPCAITSGMACVHFGVAVTTKDCDVLCDAAKSDDFRNLIADTPLRGLFPKRMDGCISTMGMSCACARSKFRRPNIWPNCVL